MLTRKDDELGKQSLKIDLAEKTFQKLNTGSTKLDEVLSLPRYGTSGLGFVSAGPSNILSTNGTPFVRPNANRKRRRQSTLRGSFCVTTVGDMDTSDLTARTGSWSRRKGEL